MKNFTFFLLFAFCSIAKAQKHGDIWLIGLTSSPPKAIKMDFGFDPPSMVIVETGIYLGNGTNSSICDNDGNLVMYTDGIFIANRLDEVMENGDNLNPGTWANASGNNGYVVAQGAFFIPKPGNNNLYYLFHMFIESVGNGAPLTKFYYTLIDYSTVHQKKLKCNDVDTGGVVFLLPILKVRPSVHKIPQKRKFAPIPVQNPS